MCDKLLGASCKKLTKTQAAYIAGIVDGEGCISLSRKKDPSMRDGYGYRPYLHVSNTRKDLIDYLHRTTNVGLVYAMKRPSKKHKQAYSWQSWSQQARSVLEQILPYLRLKRDRASIVIAFAKTASQSYGILGLPIEVRRYQKRVYSQMKRLNKRGA